MALYSNTTIPLPKGLQEHEDMGGHLIKKHVSVTDLDLTQRLTDEPEISGASRFNDLNTAENVVRELLISNQQKIENWLKNRPGKFQTTIVHRATDINGRGILRGNTSFDSLNNILVVLRRTGNDGFIYTGYPTW
ncbi:RNase A-like domain-containing protein [Paenibacillus sp. sgz5001063]|uniref:RNase A-like domain-containing protein n=1 Tax=Paenibacillus sp. sgz5001063 TaxID=3242474 RepID=UPI0036D21DAE